MAVIRITSSGKAVQVVGDNGEMFQTSKVYLEQLLQGKNPAGYILLSRLPFDAAPGRFKKSPVYEGGKQTDVTPTGELNTSNDGLSKKRLEDKKEESFFTDKVVN